MDSLTTMFWVFDQSHNLVQSLSEISDPDARAEMDQHKFDFRLKGHLDFLLTVNSLPQIIS